MAKDPNYNRYAGITSLPGDPLNPRKPRPFRVDEDGAVIYLDAPKDGEIVATAAQGAVEKSGKRSGVVRTLKTIGGVDYDVISANTYDPSLSNGKTAIPNADMIAQMYADMDQVAVTDRWAKGEKGTRTIGLPIDFSSQIDDRPAGERNLPLANPKSEIYYSLPVINPKTKSIGDADTLSFGDLNDQPIGTVALNHGHIDKGPSRSDGMIDKWDPANQLYGDVTSLLADNPMPMTTVSKGRMGWHQLEDGRLQFMYPLGSLSEHEAEEIQRNLDLQQRLFHKRRP